MGIRFELEDLSEDADAGGTGLFEAAPYSPKRTREWTRVFLAAGLLVLISVIVIWSLWVVGADQTKDKSGEYVLVRAKAIMELVYAILPAITAVFGTVVGFYFGEMAKEREVPSDVA